MTLHTQFYTLLMMVLSGMAIGAVFDAYRVLATRLRLPRWLLPLTDIVYIVFVTLLTFRLLVMSNMGEIRYHVFLGIGIGICLYFLLFSMFVIRTLNGLINLCIHMYKLALRIGNILIIKPAKLLYRIVIVLFGFLIAFSVFLYKFVLQLLYPLRVLLMWMLRPLLKRLKWPGWLRKGWDRLLRGKDFVVRFWTRFVRWLRK